MILTSPRWKLALAGAALFTAGIGTAWVLLRPARQRASVDMPPSSTSMPMSETSTASAGGVIVEIPADVAARAGLSETEVRTMQLPVTTRIAATVEPNAYAVVPITAPAGGRVLRVLPQLGDRVAAGSAIAVIHSPELAKAATDQSAAAAALSAVERDLERTRKLVAIGAASRRELEEREAERADAQARVAAARAEVRLLGGSASRSGEMTVRAASAGVITERAVNAGEFIERGAPIVTTASLSPVWVMGDIAEADIARVRVGDRATIHADAFPGLDVAGRVTYIDPEVRRETRTAQIRIEAPNQGGRLRFGMLVEARIVATAADQTLVIPSSAVQRVGPRTVVYVVTQESRSRFEERTVEIGTERDGMTQVLSGLRSGERVISTGSFFLRAEADRQGLRPAPAAGPSTSTEQRRGDAPGAGAGPAERVVRITVDAAAFSPSRISVRSGERVILRFTRISESCASEVVIPQLKLRRTLPLKQPVDVRVTAPQAGEIGFACGMNMLKGTIVVQ